MNRRGFNMRQVLRVICGLGLFMFSACSEGGSIDVTPMDSVVDSTFPIDTQAPVDTTAVDSTAPELPDGQNDSMDSEDAAPQCEPGTGCFGEACESSDDCLSSLCVPHLGNQVCSQTCGECPTNWRCKQVTTGSSDVTFICVSDFTYLCQPCTENSDCKSDLTQEACVIYEGEGRFCGAACEADEECPGGFSCIDAENASGGTSQQCVRSAGVCECSTTASELALSTPCNKDNEYGSCAGVRSCSDEGLSACDASEPTAETCNGLDDDCDG
jgi:hypothetical protein